MIQNLNGPHLFVLISEIVLGNNYDTAAKFQTTYARFLQKDFLLGSLLHLFIFWLFILAVVQRTGTILMDGNGNFVCQ